MGLYQNTNGVLTPIAGRGKAEYGASTVRTGTFTNPRVSSESSVLINVVFDEPMPDADYMLDITRKATDTAGTVCYTVKGKTANGFSVFIARPNGSVLEANLVNCDYTAFKLYTDNEYNNLLKLSRPDLWSVNTEIDLGDGLYGKRYTGIWNGAGNAEVLDASIKSPACKLVDYMAWQHRTSDNLQLIGSSYYDGGTRLFVQLYPTGVLVYHNLTDPTTYDIWIKYTKTT